MEGIWKKEGRTDCIRRMGRMEEEEEWESVRGRIKEALKETESEWEELREKKGDGGMRNVGRGK